MGIWETYESRVLASGVCKRDAAKHREERFLLRKLPGSLSYHHAAIDGSASDLAIINTDNPNIKTICSLPGEDFPHGGIVEWMGNHWIITARDANNELYTRGTMQQCNYLLRWVSEDKQIVERWCIIDDGTKYLNGEAAGKDYVITQGDSRISMTIAKDSETLRLTRENRFIIDDYGSPSPLAYRLSKPFRLGGSYDERGVLYFVLQECNTEDTDNLGLHIANYYRYFPRECDETPVKPGDVDEDGKKVWI